MTVPSPRPSRYRTPTGIVFVAMLLASCHGDSTSPTEALVATSVEVTPDSVSLARGGTVILSATVRDQNGTILTGHPITWSASDSAVATVSFNGVVTAVNEGRVVITATSSAHSGSSVVVVEPTGLDYDIVDAQFTQGVQAADGSIPMVLQGNGAVLNVLMSATPSSSTRVPMALRIYDEATMAVVFADTARTVGALGANPSYGDPTVQFLVPPTLLRAGLVWQVVRDPNTTVPDDSAANDVYPRGGPIPLETVDVPTLKVRFVPILLSAHEDATGNVTEGNLDQYTRVLQSVYPLGRVTFEVAAPFTTSASFGTPPKGGKSPFWTQVLSELDMARTADAEASDAYWFGVVRPPSEFNYTDYGGWGYIPGTAANAGPGTRTAVAVQVGWFNVESQARDNVAHELGHNFGRPHTPCGNPSNPDQNYPVPGGVLDRPGHDVFAWTHGLRSGAATVPASTGDVMGYCHPVWASTYTYEGVLQFRSAVVAAAPPVTKVLYVHGLVGPDGVRLEPAVTLDARPTPAGTGGRYSLEGLAADGSLLFTRSFDPAVIDHAPEGEGTFAVAIPLAPDLEDRLEVLRVRGPAGEAVRGRTPLRAPAGVAATPPTTRREPSGMVRVTCDAGNTQAVLVRDAAGRLLGTAPGAIALVRAPSGTPLVVGCSDGVRTVTANGIAP